MNNEQKEITEKATQTIKELGDKIEELSQDVSTDLKEIWDDIKISLSNSEEKLKSAMNDLEGQNDEIKLKANLGIMEAHEKADMIKKSLDTFTTEATRGVKTQTDILALKASLAKMDAEDFWEENGKEITKKMNDSGKKVEEIAASAASDVKEYFQKFKDALS